MNEPVVTSAVAAVIALVATLDFPTRTIYTLNARDGSDRQAVHPGGLQFVPGWQPLGTEDSQGEDQNDK